MQVIERNPKETAREYAMRVIRHNIITLALAPGSIISENELAGELGISRTPVREALIEIGRTSMVGTFPQRGSCISLIDFELVEEAVFLRMVLEKAVAELACDMAQETDIIKLEENVKLQEFYLSNSSTERLIELDNEFHTTLFRICHKERTFEMMQNMLIHFDRVRTLSVETVKDIKIISDHKAILDAIRKRDKTAAVDMIVKHLSRYKLDRKEIMERYPEYFKKSN